jgi:hypothetical protein
MNNILCLAIQCKDEKSGKIGSFVFSPNNPCFAVSPIFSSLIGLFSWLSDNGYSECKGPSILGNYENLNE